MTQKRRRRLDELDYFSGGVPTGAYFKLRLDELREIVANASKNYKTSVAGLAYIGLTAYFESFCKDHFGSIVSIVPSLTKQLAARGQNTQVDLSSFIDATDEIDHRLGFYLAEKFDFGTPQNINALFNALLTISPFSKDEAREYDRILHDRNLLVHHGGTYTTSYLKTAAKRLSANEPKRAFWDSLRIDAEKFQQDAALVESIAKKLMESSHAAVLRYAKGENIVFRGARKKAVNYFMYWE